MEKENRTENGEVEFREETDEHGRCQWCCRGHMFSCGVCVVEIVSAMVCDKISLERSVKLYYESDLQTLGVMGQRCQKTNQGGQNFIN
jgi:hypothetical protein